MLTPAAPPLACRLHARPAALAALLLALAAGCSDAPARASGAATGTMTTGDDPSTGPDLGSTSTDAPLDTTSEQPTTSDALTTTTTTTTTTPDDDSSTGAPDTGSTGSTGEPPPPDFDALPWLTGPDVGYGVAYKDSLDPTARNIFIGYAGYPFPLDAAQSWATALYHARLRELGVRHVYAVQGPATVMYSDYEIGNTSIADKLTTQAQGAAFVLVAGHSSGSYVAHELLGQLAGAYDPDDITADKLVYFNLDGGTAGLDNAAVARLRRSYYVSIYDYATGTAAPNLDAMKYLGQQWPDKGGYIELDGSDAGCNPGAPWCLHMAAINSRPHNPNKSDVVDYFDFLDRPVVTSYFDQKAAEAGLEP